VVLTLLSDDYFPLLLLFCVLCLFLPVFATWNVVCDCYYWYCLYITDGMAINYTVIVSITYFKAVTTMKWTSVRLVCYLLSVCTFHLGFFSFHFFFLVEFCVCVCVCFFVVVHRFFLQSSLITDSVYLSMDVLLPHNFTNIRTRT
jgi:hypothetical protein